MNINIMRVPDAVFIETDHSWEAMNSRHNEIWHASQVEVCTKLIESNYMVNMSIQLAATEAVHRLQIRWKQNINSHIQLLSDHWERAYGDLAWQGIQPERVFPWYGLIHDGQSTYGFGVKTGARAMCHWYVDREGITLVADVTCGNEGVQLKNRVLEVATVIQLQGTERMSSYETASQLCRLLCDKPVMPAFPVYGGNNWYYSYGESTQEQIIEDSIFISRLAKDNPNRPFMVIDDCWQLGACGWGNGGPWIGNHDFPNMEELAARMKQEGVRPGIWLRPLLTQEKVPESWVRYTKEDGRYLDASHPGVLDYIRTFTSRIHDWGYELIKHDFSTFDLFGQWGNVMRSRVNGIARPFADNSKTNAEIVLDLYQTIAEAAGDSLVIGCNTIGHLAAGQFAIQRTGDDTSGRSWERTRRMGINTLAFRMTQHGTFFSHDADCVGITADVPWRLNKQWLDVLSRSGTPLFVSVSPKEATLEQIEALTIAFEKASKPIETAEPLDWMYNSCPAEWLIEGEKVVYDWNGRDEMPLSEQERGWWQ
ncbi:hypothetical protein ABU162_13915 [Paenibacillus thiaminolyticus]|uniref:hypothetical protein n=1 Tax=Paenibacillus thiaminolyticus TaxID=49283 RepID=UPI0035A65B33